MGEHDFNGTAFNTGLNTMHQLYKQFLHLITIPQNIELHMALAV